MFILRFKRPSVRSVAQPVPEGSPLGRQVVGRVGTHSLVEASIQGVELPYLQL